MMGGFMTFAFSMLLVGLVIVALVVVLIAKLLKGGSGAENKAERTNEAKLIQELYHGLSRMEDRVESLETILLDKESKEERK